MGRRNRTPDTKPAVLQLVELQAAVIQHCGALRAVADFLSVGQTDAAVARLDQATTALHAVVKGQSIGLTMPCPACGSPQDVAAWVEEKACRDCGTALEVR